MSLLYLEQLGIFLELSYGCWISTFLSRSYSGDKSLKMTEERIGWYLPPGGTYQRGADHQNLNSATQRKKTIKVNTQFGPKIVQSRSPS